MINGTTGSGRALSLSPALVAPVFQARAEMLSDVLRDLTGIDACLTLEPDAIMRLESVIQEFQPRLQRRPDIAVAMGCFLGEVLIRSLGGLWQPDGTVTEIRGRPLSTRPMDKATRRLEDGVEHHLWFYYDSIRAATLRPGRRPRSGRV